jgi:hypothetical protein
VGDSLRKKSSNVGDSLRKVNDLVEGRSEGLEADGAIKDIRVDLHTDPVSLPAHDRLHRLPAAPFGPFRPHHRASLRPSAPVGKNSGLRRAPAGGGLVWAVLALPLLAPGSGGGRVVVGVVEGELGHGFRRNCCGGRGRGRGRQMGSRRRQPVGTAGVAASRRPWLGWAEVGLKWGELPWVSHHTPFPFSLKTPEQNNSI